MASFITIRGAGCRGAVAAALTYMGKKSEMSLMALVSVRLDCIGAVGDFWLDATILRKSCDSNAGMKPEAQAFYVMSEMQETKVEP